MTEYNKTISIEKEGHTYINDIDGKQIIIEGVGNKNIINSCILAIDVDNVTLQTGKKIETLKMNDLPTIIRLMAELLEKEAPKETPKKETKKETKPKKTSKKTTKKTSKKTTKKAKKEVEDD